MIWYFRRAGKRVRLRGEYGSDDFREAYERALAGVIAEDKPTRRGAPGTLKWLVERYLESGSYLALAPATRTARRRILDRICVENGTAPLTAITPTSIVLGRERRGAKPEAANSFVKTMRVLFGWAHECGFIPSNPAAGVKLLRVRTDGHHTWTRAEVARFRAAYAVGTMPRLALELMLSTGLRTVDVVRLGPQHERDGMFHLPATQKTGAPFSGPILASLRAVLDATPASGLVYLTTQYGRAFSVKGFGQWFVAHCRRAGVPGTAHGLRKAGATIAAEEGATEHQLMALYGWRSAKQAAGYTRQADRLRGAVDAAAAIERGTSVVKPSAENGQTGRQRGSQVVDGS